MLAAHFFRRAFEHEHPGAINDLQAAAAFPRHHVPVAGRRPQGRHMVGQHFHGHSQEPRDMRTRDGVHMHPRTGGERPLGVRPGLDELRVFEFDQHVHRVLVVAQAQRQGVVGPGPQAQRAGGQFHPGRDLGLDLGLDHMARRVAEGFVGQSLQVHEKGQQGQLVPAHGQLERFQRGIVFLLRGAGKRRHVGGADEPEILGGLINPNLLPVAAQDQLLAFPGRRQAQAVGGLEGERDLTVGESLGQPLGFGDLDLDGERAGRLIGRRFDDGAQACHRGAEPRQRIGIGLGGKPARQHQGQGQQGQRTEAFHKMATVRGAFPIPCPGASANLQAAIIELAWRQGGQSSDRRRQAGGLGGRRTAPPMGKSSGICELDAALTVVCEVDFNVDIQPSRIFIRENHIGCK